MTYKPCMQGSVEMIKPGAWWALVNSPPVRIDNETEAAVVREYFDSGILQGVWASEQEARKALI